MDKNKLCKIIIALLLLVFFSNPFLGALAATIEDKQQELEVVNQQIEVKKVKKEQAQEKTNSAYAKFLEVDRELKKEEAKLVTVLAELAEIQGQIDEQNINIAKTEASLKVRMGIYAKRIRDIYKNGQISYLDVLFGAKDFADFSTRMELLERIIKQDLKLIVKIKQEKLALIQQKSQLEKTKKQLTIVQGEVESKRQIVNLRKKERVAVYTQALSEKVQLDQEYEELMQTSQNITELIRRLESGGQLTGKGSGQLMWPVRGEITSYFGWRTHPIFGTEKYHSGLDIAVDYDVPVQAADNGQVIYAAWMSGYGYTVMLDHGDGLVTLYAHNSEVNVSEGSSVYKGQTIAFSGSTGYSTGPHVHFEVRKHGELQDPLSYLP